MLDDDEFIFQNFSARCRRIQNESLAIVDKYTDTSAQVEMWEAVLIILATGCFAFFLAYAFSFIRKNVYKDADNLDTSFDAGGNVNAGLTATTVVSQWTWAATLLQSSTVAAKYGISGSFWYAAGATIQVLLFSMLSVQLKIRAPGAKTFLQFIKARFGKRTHVVFCVFALATNVIVTAMLMLGGAAVITSLVRHISVEYAITLVTVVIGGYTFIGGLGATFYVSFFNTAIIYTVMLILIFKVYERDNNEFKSVGSISKVFDYVSCAKGPNGNEGNSYLTIISQEGLMFGLINIVGNFGTVFVDQSYWQSSVAAKPKQGVVGFLLGGLAWFAIPFSLSTTMGLAYIALSTEQGADLLSMDDINAGLVPPTVASRLLGKSGAVLLLVMILMAITSTGSAEVMAVTSIMIYDIYGVYLKPYRMTNDTNSCILCGKGRGRMANPRDKCECVSLNFCANCHADTKSRAECRRAIKPDYKCPTHGSFRVYNDYLARLKSWALVWVTMCIIPFTLLLYMADVGLGWVYLFMGVLVGSAVVPITLCMFWERLTANAMVAGVIGGSIMSMTSWLAVASTYEGGLGNFKENTGREAVMLTGNLVAILGGGLITVVLSFVGNFRDFDSATSGEIWETTRDIDNPLSPWTDKYRKELALSDFKRLDNRPSLADTQKAFRGVQILAFVMSICLSLLLILIWPSIMVAVKVMNFQEFTGWIKLSEVWALLAALLVIILPLCNEAWDIWSVISQSKKVGDNSELLAAEARKLSQTPRKQSNDQRPKISVDRAKTPMIVPDMSSDKQQQQQPSSNTHQHHHQHLSKQAVESEDLSHEFPSSSPPTATIINTFDSQSLLMSNSQQQQQQQQRGGPPLSLSTNNSLAYHKTDQLSQSVTLPTTLIDMDPFKNKQLPAVKVKPTPIQPEDTAGETDTDIPIPTDNLSTVDEFDEIAPNPHHQHKTQNVNHHNQQHNNTGKENENLTSSRRNVHPDLSTMSPSKKQQVFSVTKTTFTDMTECEDSGTTSYPSDYVDTLHNESLF